jgi:hypothetical protein
MDAAEKSLAFIVVLKYKKPLEPARRLLTSLYYAVLKGVVMSIKQVTRVLAVTAFALLYAQAVNAQGPLSRHVAEFRFGAEQVSVNLPPGDTIYLRTFFLPAGEETIFVTLSSTGDTHGGAASWFSALVNGQVCNPGNEGAGFAPGGWIPLQKHINGGPGGDGGGGPGDMHDNGIYYTWCCRGVPGTQNRVEIRMASSIQGQPVFVERSHYYIDSVRGFICRPADPIPGDAERLRALEDQLPEGHKHQPEGHKHQHKH